MKKVVLVFILAFYAFAMSACVKIQYGPSDTITDAGYVQAAQAVIDGSETIKLMDKGYILGNTAKPGPAQSWGVFGTIVATDKALYFLFWNRNSSAFDVLRKLPIADMVNVSHISSPWGPGDYISIEDKDHRFDLFTCFEMYAAENMIEKNRELLGYLNAARNAK